VPRQGGNGKSPREGVSEQAVDEQQGPAGPGVQIAHAGTVEGDPAFLDYEFRLRFDVYWQCAVDRDFLFVVGQLFNGCSVLYKSIASGHFCAGRASALPFSGRSPARNFVVRQVRAVSSRRTE
jgi:hypothetical protein